jgi:hypothetical protein
LCYIRIYLILKKTRSFHASATHPALETNTLPVSVTLHITAFKVKTFESCSLGERKPTNSSSPRDPLNSTNILPSLLVSPPLTPLDEDEDDVEVVVVEVVEVKDWSLAGLVPIHLFNSPK